MAEGAPIIPISAQLKYNIEVVCEYIMKKIPVPVRDFTSEPRLIIIRWVTNATNTYPSINPTKQCKHNQIGIRLTRTTGFIPVRFTGVST